MAQAEKAQVKTFWPKQGRENSRIVPFFTSAVLLMVGVVAEIWIVSCLLEEELNGKSTWIWRRRRNFVKGWKQRYCCLSLVQLSQKENHRWTAETIPSKKDGQESKQTHLGRYGLLPDIQFLSISLSRSLSAIILLPPLRWRRLSQNIYSILIIKQKGLISFPFTK